MVKAKRTGGAHRYRAAAAAQQAAAAAGEQHDAAAADGGGGGGGGQLRAPQHMRRKLVKRAQFLERVTQSALQVERSATKKTRRRGGGGSASKKKPLPDLSSLAGALDALTSKKGSSGSGSGSGGGSALAAAAAARQLGRGVRSSIKRSKARLAIGVQEGQRLQAVLAHPSYQADPFAAITNHLNATLPPPKVVAAAASGGGGAGKQRGEKRKSKKGGGGGGGGGVAAMQA